MLSGLTFFNPDIVRFPALQLAYRAMEDGESMPTVMNAANEVAVAAFLSGRIKFTDIARSIEKTMDLHHPRTLSSIEDVIEIDQWGRERCSELLQSF